MSISRVYCFSFLSWNPNFNSLYQNSVNFIGYVVCVSPPGGSLNSSNTATANSTGNAGTATTALPVPTNAMNGSNTDCGYWYTAVEGDQCALISVQFSLSLDDFYFLNPEIDANCTNLWLGEAYCVAPVGTITSYSDYPVTTPLISITSATFPSVTVTVSTPTTGYDASTSMLPTASGTLTNCTEYRDYDDTNNLNGCTFIAGLEAVTVDDPLEWNPSLKSEDCVFKYGFSYCVRTGDASSPTETDTTTSTASSTGPTQTGTVPGCRELYTVTDGDGCDTIEAEFDITFDQFYAWNPSIKEDCSNLWLGYAYCVNGSDSETTTTQSGSQA